MRLLEEVAQDRIHEMAAVIVRTTIVHGGCCGTDLVGAGFSSIEVHNGRFAACTIAGKLFRSSHTYHYETTPQQPFFCARPESFTLPADANRLAPPPPAAAPWPLTISFVDDTSAQFDMDPLPDVRGKITASVIATMIHQRGIIWISGVLYPAFSRRRVAIAVDHIKWIEDRQASDNAPQPTAPKVPRSADMADVVTATMETVL